MVGVLLERRDERAGEAGTGSVCWHGGSVNRRAIRSAGEAIRQLSILFPDLDAPTLHPHPQLTDMILNKLKIEAIQIPEPMNQRSNILLQLSPSSDIITSPQQKLLISIHPTPNIMQLHVGQQEW